MPLKIVSGGQTGVDRAALDVAWEMGLEHGGWCPRGRIAEDGVLDSSYPLEETPQARYSQRTSWNVRDSDGTLIITTGQPTGGTAYTIEIAESLGRACRIANPDDVSSVKATVDWIRSEDIAILNVAGPRESTQPGVYEKAKSLLKCVLGPFKPSGQDS